jgi:hypothetical protein
MKMYSNGKIRKDGKIKVLYRFDNGVSINKIITPGKYQEEVEDEKRKIIEHRKYLRESQPGQQFIQV